MRFLAIALCITVVALVAFETRGHENRPDDRPDNTGKPTAVTDATAGWEKSFRRADKNGDGVFDHDELAVLVTGGNGPDTAPDVGEAVAKIAARNLKTGRTEVLSYARTTVLVFGAWT